MTLAQTTKQVLCLRHQSINKHTITRGYPTSCNAETTHGDLVVKTSSTNHLEGCELIETFLIKTSKRLLAQKGQKHKATN